jgi:hypothetical protein
MTSLSKKPVAKKRGRPLGSKNKPATKVKPAVKTKVFKQRDLEILLDDLFDAELLCQKLNNENEALELKIESLEHKEMQYKVVIDYLETKLELK